jgi:hypothetical protein
MILYAMSHSFEMHSHCLPAQPTRLLLKIVRRRVVAVIGQYSDGSREAGRESFRKNAAQMDHFN